MLGELLTLEPEKGVTVCMTTTHTSKSIYLSTGHLYDKGAFGMCLAIANLVPSIILFILFHGGMNIAVS